jgi:Domain of unknown function (DUF4174)
MFYKGIFMKVTTQVIKCTKKPLFNLYDGLFASEASKSRCYFGIYPTLQPMQLIMKYYFTYFLIWMSLPSSAQSGSSRQIYLFAPTVKDSNLVKQQLILGADTEGVNERDLSKKVFFAESNNTSVFKKYKIVRNRFTFVLIGKDGGEKFRSHSVVSLQRLFSIIDGMPMRQDEMHKRQKDKN